MTDIERAETVIKRQSELIQVLFQEKVILTNACDRLYQENEILIKVVSG